MREAPPSTAEDTAGDDGALKEAVEAAFGPGAFALIAEDDGSAERAMGVRAEGDSGASESGSDPAQAGGWAVQDGRKLLPAQQRQPLFVFELSGALYAAPLANVVEVRRAPAARWLPHAPEWVSGLANVRGAIVIVVRLAGLLDPEAARGQETRLMVVVRSLDGKVRAGLHADRVLGLRSVAVEHAESADTGVVADEGLQQRRIAVNGQPAVLLDLERILSCESIRQFQSE